MDVTGRWLLGLLTVGLAGLSAELVLLGHYDGPEQLIPLILIAAALASIGWQFVTRSAASLLAFRSVMLLLVAAGLLGVVLHYRGNLEFQLETDPSAHGWPLFMKVMRAKAPPALAPGALSQLGLLGLVYAYRKGAPAGAST
jgi:hypothetical protein